MQGAKSLKNKLTCRRRVHLHKSVNFEIIFEKYLKIHENDAKTDSKMVEKTI